MLDDVVVSVEVVLPVVEDVSLLVVPLVLPVPLAPMLDVLGLAAVLELLLGVVLELLLGVVLELLLGVVAVEPVAGLVLLVPGLVVEALVPPALPDEPPVCAIAKPPMASAAAAANVVSVFLVVVMSFAP